jgi:hypothetical protein
MSRACTAFSDLRLRRPVPSDSEGRWDLEEVLAWDERPDVGSSEACWRICKRSRDEKYFLLQRHGLALASWHKWQALHLLQGTQKVVVGDSVYARA